MIASTFAQQSGAAAGLVSVPTTRPGVLIEAIKRGERADLAKAIGAFVIDEVSKAARRLSGLRQSVGFAARAHAVSAKGHRSDKCWMVTLTYAGDNSDWRGDHLTTALNTFRKWCAREGIPCRYVWVAELQKRGVIHYHIAAWLPVGYSMPHWDRRGWWPHGMTNSLLARHATAYLMAYLKKGDLAERGTLPKGARAYGVGGLDHSLRRARRWLRLPAFVRGNSDIHDQWRRAEGGGWTAPDGTHYPSEWAQSLIGGARGLVRICRHGVQISADGPFSWLHRGPAFVA